MSASINSEKIGNYKISRHIAGNFSSSYKCVNIQTLRVFHLRSISTTNIDEERKKEIKLEIELLASITAHDNVEK